MVGYVGGEREERKKERERGGRRERGKGRKEEGEGRRERIEREKEIPHPSNNAQWKICNDPQNGYNLAMIRGMG